MPVKVHVHLSSSKFSLLPPCWRAQLWPRVSLPYTQHILQSIGFLLSIPALSCVVANGVPFCLCSTKVACCNGIQTNGNYYYPDDDPEDLTPTPPVIIGSCFTSVAPIFPAITISTGLKKIATFTTQWYVPEEFVSCTHFMGDSILLTHRKTYPACWQQ